MIDISDYLSQPLRDACDEVGSYCGRAISPGLGSESVYDRDLSPSPAPYMCRDYVSRQLKMLDFDDNYEDRTWLQENEDLVRRKIIQLANEIEEEQNNSIRKKHTKSAYRGEADRRSLSSATSSSSRSSNGLSIQGDNRKRRLCRHFLKGHCKRGVTCDFLHDSSIFCPDQQKVFLGGLPASVTAELLCVKLSEMGYTVINKPKVLRGFTPQVCLVSMAQAQKLIEIGKIYIDGCLVDVRPYEDKKPPDDLKRSVFLGGLPNGIRVGDIKEGLLAAGVRVCNFPIIKAGFTPQVVLGSPEEAQKLIKAKKVYVAGKLVEVRPYVNFRKRY